MNPSTPNGPNEEEVVRNTIRANAQRISEMEMELGRLRSSIVEREKELACHMLLSHLLDNPSTNAAAATVDHSNTWKALNEILALLPPAWCEHGLHNINLCRQYPEVCCSRLIWGNHSITTPNFKETPYRQFAEIWVFSHDNSREKAGAIEVFYTEARPAIYVINGMLSAFMPEEQNLLNIVAERVGKFLSQLKIQERIQQLTGMLSMCTCCRKVCDSGQWKTIEAYLRERSHLVFTNSLCPTCTDSLYANSVQLGLLSDRRAPGEAPR